MSNSRPTSLPEAERVNYLHFAACRIGAMIVRHKLEACDCTYCPFGGGCPYCVERRRSPVDVELPAGGDRRVAR